MRWASSISDAGNFDAALEEATAELRRQLHGQAPNLLIAFVTRDHQTRWHELPGRLLGQFPEAVLIGCTGAGVLADGRELEGVAGLALAGAVLPGVELTAFHLPSERTPDPAEPGDPPGTERERWNRALALDDGPDPHLILLPDPFTWSGPELLDSLDRAYPAAVKLGGLCSGGGRPGEHRLFCDRFAHHRGMVGVALRGNLEVDAIVAQGCRPIGTPMFVTRHHERVIFELDGRPAVEVLQRLFDELSPLERIKAQHSLFIGIVMDPNREVYDAGDFLVRNLVGVDPQSGAIGTAAQLHKNAVVQFHLRDAETSAADLRALVTEHAALRRQSPSAGVLLFSCLGRGQGLYGQPDHDSSLVRELLGARVPIAGFFGNGEIGPVAGRTHMHGYTSSLMLFREAKPS